jgi:hypothetical protein
MHQKVGAPSNVALSATLGWEFPRIRDRKVVIRNQRRREAPFAPGFNRNMARCEAVRVDLALAFCT